MKKFAIVSLLVVAGLLLAACGGAAEPTKVSVAMDATWPPFEYVDETTKQIVGFDVDLFTAIAEKAGLDVEFVNVSWDPLLAGMAECQYVVPGRTGCRLATFSGPSRRGPRRSPGRRQKGVRIQVSGGRPRGLPDGRRRHGRKGIHNGVRRHPPCRMAPCIGGSGNGLPHRAWRFSHPTPAPRKL